MLLGEYDFDLTHRKGSLMGHVDGLNRSTLPEEKENLDDAHLKEIWEVGRKMAEIDLGDPEDGGEVVMRSIEEINLVRKELLSEGVCRVCHGEKSGK